MALFTEIDNNPMGLVEGLLVPNFIEIPPLSEEISRHAE